VVTRPGRVDVVDVDGVLTAWLRRHRAEVGVVRPDRFVYAVATTGEADTVWRGLVRALRPEAATAM
jgi:3-(3-hydroxy-phenyl)propionate hydroxylase